MAWVKFSDNFPHHPKVIGLSNEAFRLHVEAMCHANHYLTDGLITCGAADAMATTIVRALFLTVAARASDAFHAPDPTHDLPGPQHVVDELVKAGIWDADKDGFRIHDYHKYQPPREEVEARQQAEQLARQAGGRLRAAGAARDEKGRLLPTKTQLTQLPAQLPPSPGPVPGPVTGTPSPVKAKPSPRREGARFAAPTRDEVKSFWKERKLAGDPEDFFDYFENTRWRLSGGKGAVMADWHLAAQRWSRNDPVIRPRANGSAPRPPDPAAAALAAAENERQLKEARAKLARGEGV